MDKETPLEAVTCQHKQNAQRFKEELIRLLEVCEVRHPDWVYAEPHCDCPDVAVSYINLPLDSIGLEDTEPLSAVRPRVIYVLEKLKSELGCYVERLKELGL